MRHLIRLSLRIRMYSEKNRPSQQIPENSFFVLKKRRGFFNVKQSGLVIAHSTQIVYAKHILYLIHIGYSTPGESSGFITHIHIFEI